jgi:hypothetical protein
MTEVNADQLKEAIGTPARRNRAARAVCARARGLDGKPVWEGVVHVFDLAHNPLADRAYAWSSPIEGSDKRRFFAGIESPVDAVRAAIVAEQRQPIRRSS